MLIFLLHAEETSKLFPRKSTQTLLPAAFCVTWALWMTRGKAAVRGMQITTAHGRRKEGRKGKPPWILRKVVFLVLRGKNQISPLLAILWKKSFRRPYHCIYCANECNKFTSLCWRDNTSFVSHLFPTTCVRVTEWLWVLYCFIRDTKSLWRVFHPSRKFFLEANCICLWHLIARLVK